jgi:hypothetical protein
MVRGERLRFVLANVAGDAVSIAVFVTVLARAPTDALTNLLGAIPDAQARALFGGHWNMPLQSLAVEAFDIHGRFEAYFGIWPTVLRMPILGVTHRFDGRLTGPSMVLALVVALWAVGALHWRIRNLVGRASAVGAGPRPVSAHEWWAIAGFQAVVGCGSIVVFLASRPLVYHEMEMWGIAGGMASAAALFGFAEAPSVPRAVGCGLAAAITLLSRPSVGFGVVAALAFVLAIALVRRRASVASLLVLALAGVVTLGLYAEVNVARFGSPFTLPLNRQVFSIYDHNRQTALRANHGSLFGTKFIPTTVVQYTRPDAVKVGGTFPYVDFPRHRAEVFGHVVFDTLDRSSSVTASMPGLTALALLGLFTLFNRRRAPPRLRAFVLPLVVGGVIGTGGVLTLAFIADRYLADFVPPLVVLAIVGFCGLLEVERRRVRRALAAGVLALCAASMWINPALATVYQRPVRPGDPGYGRGVPARTLGRSSKRS